ncbi:MAG TPA: PQQ-dependent sugar dehydrogenase [Trueperaceae bacterium]
MTHAELADGRSRRRVERPAALLLLTCFVTSVWVLASLALAAPLSAQQALTEIAVAAGYSLEVHASGLTLPTAIEFLPDPGPEPGDPYYFVAELQGRIDVVSRDGSVAEFAMVTTYGRQDEELQGASQQGLAGLCVPPSGQYLFATFTAPDAGGIIRNHILRFTITRSRDGLRGIDPTPVAEVLADFQSAPAHQVGDCVIMGDLLYVGVGDGGSAGNATVPGTLLGKVLCMTLDGDPCPDPPYGDEGPAAYVYAKGFRNPFALGFDGSRLVAAENGIDLDRFLTIRRGADHLWDGRDSSLAAAAELVFPDPFSPVQLAYVPEGADYMAPGWSGHYVAAGFGSANVPAGVAFFGGAGDGDKLTTPPTYLVQSMAGPNLQHFAGAAVGDDGVYVTPMVPLGELGGVVLRVRYDPQAAHPVVAKATPGLSRNAGITVLEELGCTGCHEIAGEGGGIGPVLTQFDFNYGITERLNSAEYEESLRAMMADPSDPFAHMNDARAQVLAASGRQRTSVWLEYMIQEPRFDDPERQMPKLGLTSEQARQARDELFKVLSVNVQAATGLARYLAILRLNWRPLAVGAVAGALLVLVIVVAGRSAGRARRQRARI